MEPNPSRCRHFVLSGHHRLHERLADGQLPARPLRIVIVALFAVVVGGIAQWVYSTGPQKHALQAHQPGTSAPTAAIDPAEAERCKVPDFAKAMAMRKSGSCTTTASEGIAADTTPVAVRGFTRKLPEDALSMRILWHLPL